MNNNQKSKILWLLLILTILLSLVELSLESFGYDPLFVISFLRNLMPVAMLLLHASIVFTFSRGLLLILLSSLTGLLFEIVGVKYGITFGGHYEYDSQHLGLMLFNVSLMVPIYWAVFIYTGYSIVTSFLIWINENKPAINKNSFILLLLLIILDGLVVVAIDIFMDPLMVYKKIWFWHESGPYFNIPIGNFIGWFLVTIITTGIFRSLEYFCPQKQLQFDKSVYLIPVLGYASLSISFLIFAINIHLPQLAMIGIFVMMPTVIINLIYFINWKKNLSFK